MSFGINILDVNGKSTVAGLTNEFVIETIVPTSNGSKSYNVGPQEVLRVKRVLTFSPDVGNTSVSGVSVSGNTINWTVTTIPYITFPLIDSILVTKVVQ